jgi:Phage capsid protein
VGTSLLRQCVVTEAVIKGNQATFLVADSGGAVAQTRGVNGLIPARTDDLNQYTATLIEQHDLVQRTGFNLFASQGDGKRIMQETSMKVINRTIDLDILSALASATNNTGAATSANLALVQRARTKLGNNAVPIDEIDNMFFVVTSAFMGYLLQIPEFVNVQWVDAHPLTQPSLPIGASKNKRMMRWAGFNWIETPLITGVTTNDALCYAYHRDSIGHAVNTGEIMAAADYHRRQDYSWARTSIYMGSKLLQTKGVIQVAHDDTGLS